MNLYMKFLLIAIVIKCMSIFVLQNSLSFVNGLFGISVLIWTVYHQFSEKNGFTIKKCFLILCLFAVIVFPNQLLSMGKFYLLEPVYQYTAERTGEEIADVNNTYIGKYDIPIWERILLNDCRSCVDYVKQGEYYTISFTKRLTFFQWYAYVYFSEPAAVTLVTHPSLYEELDDASAYDTITWLQKDKWALVKYY